jgi:hypothetical protein
MSDTSTTLNPGAGGDVLDESLVTQLSGVQAKRPRVVLGDDLGGLIQPSEIVTLLTRILFEAKRQTVLLMKILNSSAAVPAGMDEVDSMVADEDRR